MSKLTIVLSALLLAGCATVKNMPQQDDVGAMPARPGPSGTAKSEPAEQAQPQVAVARPPASIWRQPGSGLQAGGRGGAEGNPIPLDTPEPKYQDYFNKVRQRIKAKWIYPRPAADRGSRVSC